MYPDSGSVGLLIRLVSAHLVSDFILQSSSWVAERREEGWRSSRLYLHGAIAAVAAYTIAWRWSAVWLVPAVFGTHVVIDRVKGMVGDNARSFLLDQAAHIVVVVGCWLILCASDVHLLASAVASVAADPRVWLVASLYILLFWPAGLSIGKATAPLRLKLARDLQQADRPQVLGLDRAGLWIGRLERLLMLTFVLVNHFESIGFLIAAKSILRFGDGGGLGRRKETEYILVGTLLSFVLAVGVGLFCYYAVSALGAPGGA